MYNRQLVAPLICAVLFALASCAHSDDSAKGNRATTASTTSATARPAFPPADDSDLNVPGLPPAPTGATRSAFLAASRAVAPALEDTGTYYDRTFIQHAQIACALIEEGDGVATQEEAMMSGYSTKEWAMTTQEADRLIGASRKYICPAY